MENFSILEKVPGKYYTHDEFIEFTFEDEKIIWNGIVCQNAFKYKSKRVVLELHRGLADLPKIDGIILFKGGIESIKW